MEKDSKQMTQVMTSEIVNQLKDKVAPDALSTAKAEQELLMTPQVQRLAQHHFANVAKDSAEQSFVEKSLHEMVVQEHNGTDAKTLSENLPNNLTKMATAEGYNISQLGQTTASDFQPSFSQASSEIQQNTPIPENDNEAFDRNSDSMYVRFHPGYSPIDYNSPGLKDFSLSSLTIDTAPGSSGNDDGSHNNTSNLSTLASNENSSNSSGSNDGNHGGNDSGGNSGGNDGGNSGGDDGGNGGGQHSPTASISGSSTVNEGGYANYTIDISDNDGKAHDVKIVVTPNTSNGSDIETDIEYYDKTTGEWKDVPDDGTVHFAEGEDTVDIRIKTGDDEDDPVQENNSYTVTIEEGDGDTGLSVDDDSKEVTTVIDDSNDPMPIFALDGKLILNEIGLKCSTEVNQTVGNKQFHMDAGQSYIEVKNIAPNTILPGYAIEQLAFEIAGPNGQKQTVTLNSMSGDSNSHQLGVNETLVIYSNGTWAIYNASGEIRDQNSFGNYTTSNWVVGSSTSDSLGVNMIQDANHGYVNEKIFNIDQFLANNVDTRLFAHPNDGWDGAHERGIADVNGSSSYYFASLLAHNNPSLTADAATFHDQFRGLVGDQDHTLQLLGLTKPGAENNSASETDGASNVFSRTFSSNDHQGSMDNNTEANWTTNDHGTPGQWNQYANDYNPQDPNDNLNPGQNSNQNAANAGQTILDDSLDGNTTDNNTISGGRGNDYLYGDNGNDILKGEENNDLLFGGNGNDQLYGGSGADLLVDLSGQDILEGDSGNDILIADPSRFNVNSTDTKGDLLIGDAVADWKNYNSALTGSDVIFADKTDDVIFGDTLLVDDLAKYQSDPFGYVQDHFSDKNWQDNQSLVEAQHHIGKDDSIKAGAGNDIVFGQGGNDYIDGGDGDDVIFGGDGNDTLVGGSGTNQLFGNDGNDTIISSGTNDIIKGGKGDDTIRLHANGDDSRTILYYDDVLDGNDTVEGFLNGTKPNDQINLDALFDKLGIADNERNEKVLLTQVNPNTVELTIQGLNNFSITFTNSDNNDAKSFTVGNEYTNDIIISNIAAT